MHAVVLDRDGVINDNREHVHVHTPAELVLFPWSALAIRRLNEAGLLVLVATNQGGVGLGYLSPADLDAIHRALCERLAAQGARLDGIAVCPHAPRAGCACRKPKPGLLRQLQAMYAFDFEQSYMVGDRDTDIEAGLAVGMKTVHIGHGPTQADFQAPNLWQAVDWILSDLHHPAQG